MSVTRKGLDKSAFQRYKSLEIKAGILAGATYPADTLTNARTGEQKPDPRAGMPVAVIAHALHYGNGQNHPRPFIAQATAKHKKEWAASLVKLAASGVAPLAAATTVGQLMKEDIQNEIQAWPADNSESWAAFKGFNHGLVLTGHLTRSVDSEATEL